MVLAWRVLASLSVCVCVCVCGGSIACNVNNNKQVHIDFNTGPNYHVSKRRAAGSSQHRLSVVRLLIFIAYLCGFILLVHFLRATLRHARSLAGENAFRISEGVPIYHSTGSK